MLLATIQVSRLLISMATKLTFLAVHIHGNTLIALVGIRGNQTLILLLVSMDIPSAIHGQIASQLLFVSMATIHAFDHWYPWKQIAKVLSVVTMETTLALCCLYP